MSFAQTTEQINPADPNYNVELNSILQTIAANTNNLSQSVATTSAYFTNGILGTANGGTGTTTPGFIPTGGIIMWSGLIANIPSGYVLCDGTNNTPDLRNRFIVGAVSDQSGVAMTSVTDPITPVYTQSGNGQLPLTNTNALYFINTLSGTSNAGIRSQNGGNWSAVSSNTVDFTYIPAFGAGNNNVAVYYALAFIMKT